MPKLSALSALLGVAGGAQGLGQGLGQFAQQRNARDERAEQRAAQLEEAKARFALSAAGQGYKPRATPQTPTASTGQFGDLHAHQPTGPAMPSVPEVANQSGISPTLDAPEQSISAFGQEYTRPTPAAPVSKIQSTHVDPVSGKVFLIYEDGTYSEAKSRNASPAMPAAPTMGHENDDLEHGGQQVPTPAAPPPTLTLGVKPPPQKDPVLREVGGDLYDVTDPKKPTLVQKGKPPAAPKDPNEGKPTEAQQKAIAFNHRVVPAGQRLNTFDDRKVLDQIASRANIFGNWAKSDEGRRLEQAGDAWVMSVLRPESGAQISDSERESYRKTYLPVPFDDDGTLTQKRQARREAEEAVALMAGKFLPKGAARSAMEADSTANPAAFMKKYHPGKKPDPNTFTLGRK